MMARILRVLVVAAALAACAPKPVVPPVFPQAITLDQGAGWTPEERGRFYTRSQGSEIMKLSWMQALTLPDGTPFLAGNLARYGYLPNAAGGLPVGFAVASTGTDQYIGMTCAACHTRQINVQGAAYRVDGGPALTDFQLFLTDLDTAVGTVAAANGTTPAFASFAQSVLGHPPTPAEQAALNAEVQAWYSSYHTLMASALPTPAWGLGRLDAVGMIFNRLTGLDIGTTPDRMIPGNIQTAAAPVRYPFLWNAPKQDFTQWPGFSANGNDLLGLVRNTGEVYGVFAVFHPVKDKQNLLGYNYLNQNSADFNGLRALEQSVKLIGPPKWPFSIDSNLAAKGAQIFGQAPGQGQCATCHWPQPGADRGPLSPTWKTPIQNVGTDTKEYDVLNWQVQTGVLQGATILPGTLGPLKPTDTAIKVLSVSVAGSILQDCARNPLACLAAAASPAPKATAAGVTAPPPAALTARTVTSAPQTRELAQALTPPPINAAYESRVMNGIWAAAPYLHNGSVPTLSDLLSPPDQRPASFAVGPAYDTTKIGLAAVQPGSTYKMTTTDCSALNSGNSRCGHDFGTHLSASDRAALLEYLKTL